MARMYIFVQKDGPGRAVYNSVSEDWTVLACPHVQCIQEAVVVMNKVRRRTIHLEREVI